MLNACHAMYKDRKFIFRAEPALQKVKGVFKELRSFYIELLVDVLLNCREDMLRHVMTVSSAGGSFYKEKLGDYFDEKVVLSKANLPSFLSEHVQRIEKLLFDTFVLKFIRHANPETMLAEDHCSPHLGRGASKGTAPSPAMSDFEQFIQSKSVSQRPISFDDRLSFTRRETSLGLFGVSFHQNFNFLNRAPMEESKDVTDRVNVSLASINEQEGAHAGQIAQQQGNSATDDLYTPIQLLEVCYKVEHSLSHSYAQILDLKALFKLIRSVYFLQTTSPEASETLTSLFDYSVKLPKHMLLSGIRTFIECSIDQLMQTSELKNEFQVAYSSRGPNPSVIIMFKWSFPFYYVFNEQCAKRYNQVFNHLLQIKKTKRGISNVYLKTKNRKTTTTLGLDAETAVEIGDPACLASIKQLLQQINAIRVKISVFIDSYSFYIEEKVINRETRRFNRKIDEANDFRQIKCLHDAYLADLVSKLFLDDRALAVHRKITTVVDSAVHFFLLVDNFDSALYFSQSLPRDLNALSLLAIKRNSELDARVEDLVRSMMQLETNEHYGLCKLIRL